MSRPPNNSCRCAWMTLDSRTNALSEPAIARGSAMTRGRSRGALTVAIVVSRPNASRPESSTTKLRLLLATCGNGCAGSRPIGVSSGLTSRWK